MTINNKSKVPDGVFVTRNEVTDNDLHALGIDINAEFPGSTAADFRRYPVMSEGGWFIVIKHQQTLRTVHREPWSLLGPIALLSAGLDIH